MRVKFDDIDWSTLRLNFPLRGIWKEGETSTSVDEYNIFDVENSGQWIGLLGDIHGSSYALEIAIEACRVGNITHLFQVGDFGYLLSYDKNNSTERSYHDKRMDVLLKQAYDDFGLTLHVIDGNHDNHALWHRGNSDKEPRKITHDFDDQEFPSMPIYHPRGSIIDLELEGGFNSKGELLEKRKFTVGLLGGARSVNVLPSEESQREGIDYWYDEEPTDDDVQHLISKAQGTSIDLMLTHDAPVKNHLVSGMRLSDHMEYLSHLTRKRICYAVEKVAPDLLVHGHWHQWSTGMFLGEKKNTKLLCLPEEYKQGNIAFLNTHNYDVIAPRGFAKIKNGLSIHGDENYFKVFG